MIDGLAIGRYLNLSSSSGEPSFPVAPRGGLITARPRINQSWAAIPYNRQKGEIHD